MEIGISMFGDLLFDETTQKFQSPQKRLQEMVEEIKLADEVGLDVFGIGEHHRPDYAISSPEIILAAAATVTKKIKLSSAVTVLSSADPVRVYQNFSTLDLLSSGRAEITVGRGSFTESFPLFGYDLENYEELFTEKLNLLLNINIHEETLNWTGRFRPSLHEQQILPRAGRPLDIWVAVGGTPESIIRAAHLGLPLVVAIIGGMPARFTPLFDLYKSEYAAAGHPEPMRIGIHAHGLLGDSMGLADEYFPRYAQQMNRIGKSRGWSPYTRAQFEGGMSPDGALFIGEPNAVIDKILRLQKLFGLTRFMMHMDIGAPDHRDIMRSIELFGTKILPAVRRELGTKN